MKQDEGFDKEIRFAVVMYGGVSLAVYMNGIAQELLHMVRATAPRDGDPMTGQFRWRPEELTGTERVYRQLAGELRARFVVDIVSGTSAGGINGVFLAKALASDRSLDRLRTLWVQEGDIGRLLNDARSLEGGLSRALYPTPPPSLLNGQRFYWELLDALEEMDSAAPHAAEMPTPPQPVRRAPYVDEIDLYVTATDFQGAKLPLALFDTTIDERVHRKVFHFRYWKPGEAEPERDDFRRDLNPMLAFAARCTASFPAAFAPFKLEDIDASLQNHPAYRDDADQFGSTSERWRRFFGDYPGYAGRYFVDGGYLDNKPFEAAIGALANRHHVILPSERKLLYIEPDPERQAREAQIPRPDVVSALLAVSSLPRVETIRAEIDEITRRNRIYERASVLTSAVEEDARKRDQKRQRSELALDWARNDLRALINVHGLAYGGYHRLKISRMTDWLAECLFASAGGHSDGDTVRTWVRHWRDSTYVRFHEDGPSKPTENRLLIDLDVAYRLRRMEFVRIKLRETLCGPEIADKILALAQIVPPHEHELWEGARKGLLEIQQQLQQVHQRLLSLNRACLALDLGGFEVPPPAPTGPALQAFKSAPSELTAQALLGALGAAVAGCLTKIGEDCRAILKPEDDDASNPYLGKARQAFGHFYSHYDDFDLVGFPMLYCLGTDDLSPVQVHRVSAADTTLAGKLGAQKLAGVKLGHFGAFLSGDWRENDIFWGRLDGAERIISALANGGSNATATPDRDGYLDAAFTAIIEERKQAIAAATGPSPPPASAPVTTAAVAQAAAPRPTAAASRARIKDEVTRLTRNQDLPPEKTLQLLARSTAIVRQMMGGVANQRGLEGNVVIAWGLRLLTAVWGVVELAIPRSLSQLLLRYWLQLVMLSGALLAVVGSLFDRPNEVWMGSFAVAGAVLARVLAEAIAAVATHRVTPFVTRLSAGAAAAGLALSVFATWKAQGQLTGAVDMLALELARDHTRLTAVLAGCDGKCVTALVQTIQWDFLFAIGYGLLLAGLSLLNRAWMSHFGWNRLTTVALGVAAAAGVAALSDAVENAGLLLTLGLSLWRPLTADTGVVHRALAHLVPALTFAASSLKWGLVSLVVLFNLGAGILGLATLALHGRRRSASRSTG